ncbi:MULTISPECIES: PilZ domain-containing protein [unclassified Rhizobium]|uniref:PilZ domain-containing protein n=1 Tax=unclassified Rhizobium TaxID=2613769 RepID=UPI0016049740|nr:MULTISPECIES: PilZ domain-containing protein [unclassified Rhizobium]MBB1248235.1 PilZ domain-containing protein [Rhizobium sp. G21]MCV3765559.1 PilZ domain-containing protein [Rhizobium sp. TRM95796]
MAVGAEATISTVHVEQGLEAKKFERFIVNRPGVVYSVLPGLAGLSPRSCQVVDISRGGACLQMFTTIGLPDHYYLSFSGLAIRIGCAEVHRLDGRVGVRFIKPLPEGLLSKIVRGDFIAGDNLPGRVRFQ